MADKIRIIHKEKVGAVSGYEPAKWFIVGLGKSSVTKPTKIDDEDIAQGSVIFETDNKKSKYFDEESGTWG